MALNAATLEQLARDGYGPLRFVVDADGWRTQWGAHPVSIRADVGTLRVVAERTVSWPGTRRAPGEIERRVERALAEVIVGRPELLSIEVDPRRSQVVTSIWVDVEHAGPPDLASAVRAAVVIGDLAEWSVEVVGVRLAAEAELLDLTGSAESDLEAATAALAEAEQASVDASALMATAAAPGPVPDRPPPVAPVAPERPSPAPPPARPTEWCYVMAPTDVLDPSDTSRTLARLEPGAWYRLVAEREGWTRVADADRTFEGWAPANRIHRRDAV